MKITPKKYAQALALTLEETKDSKAIILNFLKLLQRRKQFKLLPKILKAFEEEWNQRRGIVKIRVSYPSKFQESLVELEKTLQEKLGKAIAMEAKASDELIGGFRIQADDTLIDGSVGSQLKRLLRRLSNL